MATVLLVGGSGILGAPAARVLRDAGHRVTVLSRRGAVPDGIEGLAADRADPASLAAALAGRRFDLAVDLLAYDAADVLRLAPLLRADRRVLVSTGQVYLVGRDRRPPFREADLAPPMPEPEPGGRAHANWAYGMGKRAAEAAFGTGADRVVLRLPMVVGAGDRSRRVWAYLQRLRDGGPLLLPGGGADPVRMVWAEDAARLLLRLAEGLPTPSPVYNVAMPEDVPVRTLVEALAAHLGATPPVLPCDEAEALAAGVEEGWSPWSGPWCSRPDPGRLRQELGFATTPWSGWLAPVVDAHLAEPAPADHPAFAGRAAELRFAAELIRRAPHTAGA